MMAHDILEATTAQTRETMDQAWDPEGLVRSMEYETKLDEEGESPDYSSTAQRLMLERLPEAAAAVVHLALYSENEKIRLDAAKRILDQGLGRPAPDSNLVEGGASDPLRKFIEGFTEEVEIHANSGSDDNEG